MLGYLPQEFGVYPSLTSQELLSQIADLKGITNKAERKEMVDYLLQKVNLYEVRKKKIGTYSGGMKQRFGIAQALLGSPELIIVDEPTAGLDPLERNRFYNLLSEIGENTVVILSTHIVEDVSTLCNDMAIIGGGKVLLTGKPSEIEQSLRGKLWEAQIDRTELSRYREQFDLISTRFHLGKMLITIVSNDIPNGKFLEKRPALEDAYFNQLFQSQPNLIHS
ncbi:MAG: ATP-binding cassette domain-containing protein [Mangrovibacterium sp.]